MCDYRKSAGDKVDCVSSGVTKSSGRVLTMASFRGGWFEVASIADERSRGFFADTS